MGTSATLHKKEEAKHAFKWCAEANESGQRSAKQQYLKAIKAQYFMWTLCVQNRPKGEEIIRALVARLVEATEGMDAITDEEAFCKWYAAHKMDPGARSSANVAVGRACNYLGGHMDGRTDLEGALAVNQFINAWLAAMNDAAGESEPKLDKDLRAWLRKQVTEKEFCNGYT